MPGLSNGDPHDEAEELLPWYATGQLDECDRVRVEDHLSSCSDCREQLTFERRIVQECRTSDPETDAGWTRLRSRIQPQRNSPRQFPQRDVGFWKIVRHPAVGALAAAQVGFLVLAGGILFSLSRPAYHALGSPPPSVSANVIVIFRADATEEDIRDALRASGASIIGGPTAADAYLIRVSANQRAQALGKLRSDDDVQMAEPIDGTVP
ncbi:MAG: zf-HC2 domain-containing protein [Sphingomicrobium sp.]